MIILGGLAFFENQGIWFKLSPALTVMIMGLLLGGHQILRKESLLFTMMKEASPQKFAGQNLPPVILQAVFMRLQRDLALFLIAYGFLLIALALWSTTSIWAFFKTAGFYVAFIIFMIAEMILLRFSLKKSLLRNTRK
jgi:intracellular septation protein